MSFWWIYSLLSPSDLLLAIDNLRTAATMKGLVLLCSRLQKCGTFPILNKYVANNKTRTVSHHWKNHHSQQRFYSSSALMPLKYFNVKSGTPEGAVVLEMNYGSVNAMSPEFMKEFSSVLDHLNKDTTCRGIVITSAHSVFCAGLDIRELHEPDDSNLREMWKYFQDTVILLHGSPKVTIAAINGTAVAGGCLLSLCCDYRIIGDGKHQMGMQAAQLGITVPVWLQEIVRNTAGSRQTDLMLQRALVFYPDKALELGLVDRVVPDGTVVEEAQRVMGSWLAVPDAGRQLTKQELRKPFLESFKKLQKQDEDFFLELVHKQTTQEIIKKYMNSLKNKS